MKGLTHLALLLATLLLGANAGQATTLAAYYSPDQIVIGADTRICTDDGQVLSDEYCKLRRVGTGVMAAAGLVELGDVAVLRILTKACARLHTVAERVEVVETQLARLAANQLNHRKGQITVLIADRDETGLVLATVEATFGPVDGRMVCHTKSRLTNSDNYRIQGQGVVIGPTAAKDMSVTPGYWFVRDARPAVLKVIEAGKTDSGSGGATDLVELTAAGFKHTLLAAARR